MSEKELLHYQWTEFFDDVGSTRKEQRRRVVLKFLEEDLGQQYCYHVASLEGGKGVCLVRPTYLNKGVDFQVWVLKHQGGSGVQLKMQDLKNSGKRPSHEEIFRDLDVKRNKNPRLFRKFMEAVEAVAECGEPKVILARKRFDFGIGLTDEYVLNVLKWLLIEQDVTYWNNKGKGRNWNWGFIRWVASGEADIKTILTHGKKRMPPPEKFAGGLPDC